VDLSNIHTPLGPKHNVLFNKVSSLTRCPH